MFFALLAGGIAARVLLRLHETMIGKKPQETPPPDDHYWEIELEPPLRDALLEYADGTTAMPSGVKRKIKDAVLSGRRMDGQLVREGFDWSEAEAEAKRRGESLADYIWDRGRRGK